MQLQRNVYRILVGEPLEKFPVEDKINTDLRVMQNSHVATTSQEWHPVMDFGIISVESLLFGTIKLRNYTSKRKTALVFCQFLSNDIKF
jgi:hypothetical protein